MSMPQPTQLRLSDFEHLSYTGQSKCSSSDDDRTEASAASEKDKLLYKKDAFLFLHVNYGRNRPDVTHMTTGCLSVYALPVSKAQLLAEEAAKLEAELRIDDDVADPNKKPEEPHTSTGRPRRKKAQEAREFLTRYANDEPAPEVVVTTTTRSGRQSRRPPAKFLITDLSSDSDDDRVSRRKRKRGKSSGGRCRGRPTGNTGGTFDVVVKLVVEVTNSQTSAIASIELSRKPETGQIQVSERKVDAESDSTCFSRILVGDILIGIDGREVDERDSPSSIMQQMNNRLNSRGSGTYLFQAKRKITVERTPTLKDEVIDPQKIFDLVYDMGGFHVVQAQKAWQHVRRTLDLGYTTSSGNTLRKAYETYFNDLILS